jgi:four helix bundle protein
MTEDRNVGIMPTMPIKDATELRIYQEANSLLVSVYALTSLIPERELRDQMQRAARSIAPLIREGFAKKQSAAEFKRYLMIALGSSDEMQAHLEQVRLIYELDTRELENSFKELSKQIQQTHKVWM